MYTISWIGLKMRNILSFFSLLLLVGFFMTKSSLSSDAVNLKCALSGQLPRSSAVESVCKYVAEALLARTAGTSVRIAGESNTGKNSDKFLRVEITQISSSSISGRLTWVGRGNATTAGPLVTTSIVDATLNDRTLREFAIGLVQVSNIDFLKD